MSSLAMKRVVATALAGAAIASAIGATTASARPGFAMGSAADTLTSPSVPPPPSSLAAPAGRAYEELRAPDQPTGASQPVAGEPAPSGFDLPSAAIGAATGAGLVIVLLAVGGIARRRPLTRSHGTAGA
jgi:hypothetical protein